MIISLTNILLSFLTEKSYQITCEIIVTLWPQFCLHAGKRMLEEMEFKGVKR